MILTRNVKSDMVCVLRKALASDGAEADLLAGKSQDGFSGREKLRGSCLHNND